MHAYAKQSLLGSHFELSPHRTYKEVKTKQKRTNYVFKQYGHQEEIQSPKDLCPFLVLSNFPKTPGQHGSLLSSAQTIVDIPGLYW